MIRYISQKQLPFEGFDTPPGMRFSRLTSTPQEYKADTAQLQAVNKITARFPFIEKVVADGAYAGPIAQSNRPRPIEIVKRSDQAKGFVRLPKRWIVERTFAWLGINRSLSKDF